MCHPLQMGKKSQRELNNCRASSSLTKVFGHGFPKDCSCKTDSTKEVKIHATVHHQFGCLSFLPLHKHFRKGFNYQKQSVFPDGTIVTSLTTVHKYKKLKKLSHTDLNNNISNYLNFLHFDVMLFNHQSTIATLNSLWNCSFLYSFLICPLLPSIDHSKISPI